jgi:Ni,Fe-hydrogenase III small subunit
MRGQTCKSGKFSVCGFLRLIAKSCQLKEKMMLEPFQNVFRFKLADKTVRRDAEFEKLGTRLKEQVHSIFSRSLAIREVDSGSDNAAEIELNNLTNPYYDIERFGISIVASPRHADILVVTGAVTLNMVGALVKTYEAMASPKFVLAVGDDACDGGIFKNTYAVRGGVDQVIPVDAKIPGNPPSPHQIMLGLLSLMNELRMNRKV